MDLSSVAFIVYLLAAYWAAGQTIYANKVMIGQASEIILHRLVVGVILGIILIPVALLKQLLFRG